MRRAESNTARVIAQGRIDTPMGTMTAAVTSRGLAGLWFDHQSHHPGALDAVRDDDHEHVRATKRWLDAYWRGEPTGTVALDPDGTTFQQAVWRALLAIERGHTCSYGDIAAGIGRPAASRAVGAAVGRNPVGIIVPCHRVIGRDGTLTGYAGGLDRKQRLLEHEGSIASSVHAMPLFDDARSTKAAAA
jgi:methylated-DNA-[protein]-cysteine S-methyltransferase